MTSPRLHGGVVLALALLGATGARADDWGGLGLDGSRSRQSAERSGSLFGPARWDLTLPAMKDGGYRALISSPAAADGYLIFGTLYNRVGALREHDGGLVWEVALGDAVHASPAVWRGWAYVVTTDRELRALRISDGSTIWKRTLGGISYASPVVAEGSVFVASGDPEARVYRLDAETGKLVWEAGAGLFEQVVYAPVVVADGHVIVAENRGGYHSFALTSGELEWTARAGGMVNVSSPLVMNGRVYAVPGGTDRRAYAFDLGTGRPVAGWPVELPTDGPAEGGALVDSRSVVSSLAGLDGQLVLDRRVELRLDGDGDGLADLADLRETVLALDPHDGRLSWSKPNGQVRRSLDGVPTHGICPTPALYRSGAGETLVAVASSVTPTLRVLELASGAERWTGMLAGPTRGSPILANGRLVVGTDAGVIHSFLSRTNAPPMAPRPQSPTGGLDADAAAITLRWAAALDPEGESARHEVRLDDDGEVLHDWDIGVVTAPGQLALEVQASLAPGRLYTFAVRGRDSSGAFSAWSPPGQFRAVTTPAVQLDGQPVASLAAALAQARAGSVIALGVGTFPLSSTLHLPPGVTLRGEAPHLTTLTGKGLAVAVRLGEGNRLAQLTVAEASVGVEVASGQDARLSNVVLRDNQEAGLSVAAGAGAELASSTLVRNGAGARARGGKLAVRNAIVTANRLGLEATVEGTVSTRYNDVFGNREGDYLGTERSPTDRAEAVTFLDRDDLRLQKAQASTDQGDPADEFSNEPLPNGGRINLGAFGNTSYAELSDLIPPPPPPHENGEAGGKKRTSGGLCALGSGGAPAGDLLLVALALLAPRALRRRPFTSAGGLPRARPRR